MLLLSPVCIFAQQADAAKMESGLKAYSEGSYEIAAQDFESALASAPDDPQANFNFGAALYKKGDFKNAIPVFEKALTSPDDQLRQNAFYNLGNARFSNEEYEQAIESYKKALQLNPEDLQAKHNLELAQRKLKEKEDQEKQDQNQQNDNIEPSEFAKQLKARAEILVSQRLYREAFDLMQKGLRSDETVAAFQSFINRLKEVADIEKIED